MKVRDICSYLESLAPLAYQEDYDNSGLITGHLDDDVSGVLVALDCVEEVIDEAIRLGYNMVVAHHPIVFKGLKKLNGKNYVERTVIHALRNGIAMYAIHTNFDNYEHGVNKEIGERLGLTNVRILAPKQQILNKIVFFVPNDAAERVLEAMFRAGGGRIGNYSECSFSSEGSGTFKPMDGADPFEGRVGERSHLNEKRVEVLVEAQKAFAVISAMKKIHPYEEVAYELYPLLNENQTVGAGMVGVLPQEMSAHDFLRLVKGVFSCGVIRHTKLLDRPIRTVAFCGGAGSFLLPQAKRAGADIFLTGDYKYHEFFDAEGEIVIADIGHFESEQFTSHRLATLLTKKFTTFAVRLTEVDTNPIKYF